jgi:hypothetical protein
VEELARQRPQLAPVLFGAKPLREVARRPFFLAGARARKLRAQVVRTFPHQKSS